jgi:hypothetical protein
MKKYKCKRCGIIRGESFIIENPHCVYKGKPTCKCLICDLLEGKIDVITEKAKEMFILEEIREQPKTDYDKIKEFLEDNKIEFFKFSPLHYQSNPLMLCYSNNFNFCFDMKGKIISIELFHCCNNYQILKQALDLVDGEK